MKRVFITQAPQIDCGVAIRPGSCHAAGVGLVDVVGTVMLRRKGHRFNDSATNYQFIPDLIYADYSV